VKGFDDLVEIVRRLRAADGCPWDRAQTEASMRPYLLEEVHEVLDAIDRGDDDALERELGDLLFHVVFLSRLAEDRGAFDLDRVIAGIAAKMYYRHPHVFDPDHRGPRDTWGIAAWEDRKATERPPGTSVLDGVPQALPALLRAHRVSEKAAAVGFDWEDPAGVRAKLDEEVAELDAARAQGDRAATAAELGDVLFTAVNLARHLGVAPEDVLREATNRFEGRFRRVEAALQAEGRQVRGTDMATLEALWQKSKGDPP
jgi:MazG family protein